MTLNYYENSFNFTDKLDKVLRTLIGHEDYILKMTDLEKYIFKR